MCWGGDRLFFCLKHCAPWEAVGLRGERDQPFSAVLLPAHFQLPQPPTCSPTLLLCSCAVLHSLGTILGTNTPEPLS